MLEVGRAYALASTTTGRLSSSDPNLMSKEPFLPRPTWSYIGRPAGTAVRFVRCLSAVGARGRLRTRPLALVGCRQRGHKAERIDDDGAG